MEGFYFLRVVLTCYAPGKEIVGYCELLGQDESDSAWITEEYDDSSSGGGAAHNSSLSIKENVIATTWKDGPYLLVVKVLSNKPEANWYLTGEMLSSDAFCGSACVRV